MAILAPQGPFRAFDQNGDPLNGGKLYTYEAGTSTPKQTFTDANEGTPNLNPIILDSEGYANVWLESGAYKFVLDDANDVEQWSIDDISGSDNSAFGSAVVFESTNFNLNSTYRNNLIVTTASLTASLFSAVSAGEGFLFSIQNSSDGVLTIDPDGSETINGAATLAIPSDGGTSVVSDGTNWQIISAVTVTSFGDNTLTGDNTFTGTSDFTGNVTVSGDTSITGNINTPDEGELTIVAGAITPLGVYHTVDTELDAASDDLDTINGGTDGKILVLRQEDDARDIVITNAGNIVTPDGTDIDLLSTSESISFIYDAALSKWVVTSSAVVSASTTRAGASEYATSAEAQAKTAADKTITPSNLSDIEFESSAITIGSGTQTYSASHGFGVIPKNFKAILKCTTADGNWVVGDEADITTQIISGVTSITAYADASVVGLIQANLPRLPNKTTAALFTIDANDWDLYLRAWV